MIELAICLSIVSLALTAYDLWAIHKECVEREAQNPVLKHLASFDPSAFERQPHMPGSDRSVVWYAPTRYGGGDTVKY